MWSFKNYQLVLHAYTTQKIMQLILMEIKSKGEKSLNLNSLSLSPQPKPKIKTKYNRANSKSMMQHNRMLCL